MLIGWLACSSQRKRKQKSRVAPQRHVLRAELIYFNQIIACDWPIRLSATNHWKWDFRTLNILILTWNRFLSRIESSWNHVYLAKVMLLFKLKLFALDFLLVLTLKWTLNLFAYKRVNLFKKIQQNLISTLTNQIEYSLLKNTTTPVKNYFHHLQSATSWSVIGCCELKRFSWKFRSMTKYIFLILL